MYTLVLWVFAYLDLLCKLHVCIVMFHKGTCTFRCSACASDMSQFIVHNTFLYSGVCGIIWTFARNGKGYVLRARDALDYVWWSFRNGWTILCLESHFTFYLFDMKFRADLALGQGERARVGKGYPWMESRTHHGVEPPLS